MSKDSNKSIVDDPSQWQNVKPDPFAASLKQALDGRTGVAKGGRGVSAPKVLERGAWTGSDNEHKLSHYHQLRDYIDDALLMLNRRDLPDGGLSDERCEELRHHLCNVMRHTPRHGWGV